MSEQDFTRVFTIRNHGGLHARPAKVLVNLAKPFSCAIKGQNVSRDNGRELNLKSLMGVLGLGVKQGNQLRITAHGEDAEQALAAMADGIADGLGEPLPPLPAEEQAEKPEPAQPAATAMTPQLVNGELTAIGASPGIASLSV